MTPINGYMYKCIIRYQLDITTCTIILTDECLKGLRVHSLHTNISSKTFKMIRIIFATNCCINRKRTKSGVYYNRFSQPFSQRIKKEL